MFALAKCNQKKLCRCVPNPIRYAKQHCAIWDDTDLPRLAHHAISEWKSAVLTLQYMRYFTAQCLVINYILSQHSETFAQLHDVLLPEVPPVDKLL